MRETRSMPSSGLLGELTAFCNILLRCFSANVGQSGLIQLKAMRAACCALCHAEYKLARCMSMRNLLICCSSSCRKSYSALTQSAPSASNDELSARSHPMCIHACSTSNMSQEGCCTCYNNAEAGSMTAIALTCTICITAPTRPGQHILSAEGLIHAGVLAALSCVQVPQHEVHLFGFNWSPKSYHYHKMGSEQIITRELILRYNITVHVPACDALYSCDPKCDSSDYRASRDGTGDDCTDQVPASPLHICIAATLRHD